MFSQGSVCLLVFMGLVMAFGNPIHHATANLQQKYNSIVEALGLSKTNGEIEVFKTISRNSSCQGKFGVQVMNATLDVYRRIFSSVLHDNTAAALLHDVKDKTAVTKNLRDLKHAMVELQRELDEPRRIREQMIRKLSEIQVDDTMVQKKALRQFTEIYRAVTQFQKFCSY